MLDWLVRTAQDGKPNERSSPFSSPAAAIDAGNEILQKAPSSEVTVYHRLHSHQACLTFRKTIPADEIRQKAAHLEKQAQLAARSG
jgi:hypothetical protein